MVSHQKVNFKVNLNLYKDVMLSMKNGGKKEESKTNDVKVGEETS